MINPFKEVNWKPDRAELRKFGWTVLIGFTLIAALLLVVQAMGFKRFAAMSWTVPVGLFCCGAVLLLIAYSLRPLALILYRVWFLLACCIGIVLSNLILLAFFYLFFTPFAIGFRMLSGRDPLRLRKPSGCATYWYEIVGKRPLEQYLRQY